MKKVLAMVALVLLASCSSTAPVEQTPSADTTAVVTPTVSVDTTAVADSCAIDTVK